MIVKEYGKSNEDIIMLLHGGGLSWWNYEEVSEILKKQLSCNITNIRWSFRK